MLVIWSWFRISTQYIQPHIAPLSPEITTHNEHKPENIDALTEEIKTILVQAVNHGTR